MTSLILFIFFTNVALNSKEKFDADHSHFQMLLKFNLNS